MFGMFLQLIRLCCSVIDRENQIINPHDASRTSSISSARIHQLKLEFRREQAYIIKYYTENDFDDMDGLMDIYGKDYRTKTIERCRELLVHEFTDDEIEQFYFPEILKIKEMQNKFRKDIRNRLDKFFPNSLNRNQMGDTSENQIVKLSRNQTVKINNNQLGILSKNQIKNRSIDQNKNLNNENMLRKIYRKTNNLKITLQSKYDRSNVNFLMKKNKSNFVRDCYTKIIHKEPTNTVKCPECLFEIFCNDVRSDYKNKQYSTYFCVLCNKKFGYSLTMFQLSETRNYDKSSLYLFYFKKSKVICKDVLCNCKRKQNIRLNIDCFRWMIINLFFKKNEQNVIYITNYKKLFIINPKFGRTMFYLLFVINVSHDKLIDMKKHTIIVKAFNICLKFLNFQNVLAFYYKFAIAFLNEHNEAERMILETGNKCVHFVSRCSKRYEGLSCYCCKFYAWVEGLNGLIDEFKTNADDNLISDLGLMKRFDKIFIKDDDPSHSTNKTK